jgi:hypothetical protein
VAAEEWKAVSPAGPLSPGARIRVTALDGLVLTVEPLPETSSETSGIAPLGSEHTPADVTAGTEAPPTEAPRTEAHRTGGTT